MQIKGKKRYIKRAVCFARALNIYDFNLKITTKKGVGSWCQLHPDGSFTINLEPVHKYWQIRHLAHEMVHLKQYKHDELVNNNGSYLWKGEPYVDPTYMSDDYYLAPWEMEARALESWLVRKWETRARELH